MNTQPTTRNTKQPAPTALRMFVPTEQHRVTTLRIFDVLAKINVAIQPHVNYYQAGIDISLYDVLKKIGKLNERNEHGTK